MSLAASISTAASARAAQHLEEAFPDVDPLIEPLGAMVLVQLRRPKLKSAGGIILTADSQDFDKSFVRIGRVLAIGPIAFKSREKLEPWPEGAWVKVGDYVRVPAMANVDSWRVQIGAHKEHLDGADVEVKDWVTFCFFNDYDMKGRVKGDPMAVVDYV